MSNKKKFELFNCGKYAFKMKKTLRVTITVSTDAYRALGEINPTQKASLNIRQILEACVYFKGNFYELLATIAQKPKDKKTL